jgi:hypothetical protein
VAARRRSPPDEQLLGTADLQSLADLGNSFEVIRNMRPVPFAMYQAVLLAAAAAPMLPLLPTVFPLDELVLRSVRSLSGCEAYWTGGTPDARSYFTTARILFSICR